MRSPHRVAHATATAAHTAAAEAHEAAQRVLRHRNPAAAARQAAMALAVRGRLAAAV
jgi:hypothetical protein